ncbi:TPA: hypothetical protein DCZ14_03115 [Candidatus Azambacteria bacterium]|nr:hypothetical protein [Candidatus Azambacteria bacterium]HCB35987.1 hypothetical protein [Candidatus Azambacteria bacterium]
MAYSPFSRLAYLDGGHGRDKWNSNDTDVDIINPKTSGRYQVRYFSLGGSKNEIKSSLIGISKISALLPELFENSQKLERIKNFLKENDEIKNRALELRWIREQVGQLDEKRRDMSSSISTLKELDQKNGKFRNYFAKVQEMMQIELARFA